MSQTIAQPTHTPGPWTLRAVQPGEAVFKRPFWEIGAEVSGKGVAFAFGNDEANARLIAAAPDLLAACKAVIGLGAIPTTQPEHRQLEAAIAKATGGAS